MGSEEIVLGRTDGRTDGRHGPTAAFQTAVLDTKTPSGFDNNNSEFNVSFGVPSRHRGRDSVRSLSNISTRQRSDLNPRPLALETNALSTAPPSYRSHGRPIK